jgi:hypothetical protein
MRTEMSSFGLCKDEFEATGHWPPQLYVRESVRMVNEYVLREGPPNGMLSVVHGVAPDNSSIGIGNWGIDVHQVQRVASKLPPRIELSFGNCQLPAYVLTCPE